MFLPDAESHQDQRRMIVDLTLNGPCRHPGLPTYRTVPNGSHLPMTVVLLSSPVPLASTISQEALAAIDKAIPETLPQVLI
jgi:hypothetical protein